MSAKIALRLDVSALQLRKLAQRCPDSRQARRLLALAAVYDGMSLGASVKDRRDGSPAARATGFTGSMRKDPMA